MGQISQTDARNLFTKRIMDVYQERIPVKRFLGMFFPGRFSPTKEVSIEVERGYEKVAVDVVRGSEGHFHSFSKSTEKIFVPPMWRGYINATELDLYDRVLGAQGTDNSRLFAALLNSVADKVMEVQKTQERAKEIQCAQVLQTGIVTLVNGDNIDFKRRAASIVDLVGAGGYWTTGATDMFAQFRAAGDFLRKFGKFAGKRFVCILGGDALSTLLANSTFLSRQNVFHMSLDSVVAPSMEVEGALYHGTLTGGPYQFELWTYPEFYDLSGTSTPYIAENYAVVIPQKPRFVYASCLVPQLAVNESGAPIAPQTGEYVYGEYIDSRKAKHDFDVQSAGLPIPVAVDQIYTMKVKA